MTTQISAANIQASTLENLGGSPTITQVQVCDSNFTVLDDTAVGLTGGFIRITGTRFASGCQVLIDQVPATSVTFTSATELRVQVPALSAGTYILYVVNTDGSTAIRVNALTASQAPAWVTGSALGGAADAPISLQLTATPATTYQLANGSTLPAGLSLSSGGLLSGTITGLTTETVYNFTVVATDLELQDSPRSFAITITVNDPQFPLVTTLLNPDLSVQPFNRDASTNNFVISVSGDTRANGFSPYTPGYYSNFFDGSGDFLTLPTSTALGPTTGDYTWEAWLYPTVLGSNKMIYASSQTTGALAIGIGSSTANRLTVFRSGVAFDFVGTTDMSVYLNRWVHVAVTKQSGTTRFWIDGVNTDTFTTNHTYVAGGTAASIGRRLAVSEDYTGSISNMRLVNGTAVYTANFTPPTQPLTAVTNTTLLTCQSNGFIDNSTNNFAITRSGDVRVDGFDPFVIPQELLGRGSAFFDGTGDFLSIPNNSAFNLGTNNFTIEFWLYPIAPTTGWVLGKGDASSAAGSTLSFHLAGTNWEFYSGGSAISLARPTLIANTWQHVAVVRNTTTITIYLNGTSVSSASVSTSSINTTTQPLQLGSYATGGYNGYISNFRVVNGTAVYTANFTPPTQPLTAITNTSVLTCQTNQPHNNNQFLDSSTNNFLLTRSGNTTQGSFSPYGGSWSNYFDGTGDHLTLPSNNAYAFGTDAYTMEGWVNLPTGTNNKQMLNISGNFLLGTGGFGGSTVGALRYFDGATTFATGSPYLVATGNWVHFAVVRENTATNGLKLYVNGVLALVGTSNRNHSTTSTVFVGAFDASDSIQGYISNLRVVRGTAVYTTASTTLGTQVFTPPTQPLQSVAGTILLTCCDNRLVDDSPYNQTITRNGDVRVDKFSPFGIVTAPTPITHSVYFDGTTDELSLPSSSAFNFGEGNFTLEMWVNLDVTNIQGQYFFYATGLNPNMFLWNNGLIYLRTAETSGEIVTPTASGIVAGRWHHLACVRSGNTYSIYRDGVLVVSGTSTAVTSGNSQIFFGKNLRGYISNFRFVKGTALYTANFTPPTQPLTAVTNTSLLTCQNSTFVDNSTNRFAITATADARPSQVNPFGFTPGVRTSYTPQVFSGSMTFDGTGDYLQSPSQFTITTGPFTIEAWVYLGSVGTAKMIVDNAVWQGGQNAGYRFSINTSNFIDLSASTGTFNTFPTVITATSSALTTGQWNHISCTRDSSNVVRLFVNGVSVATPVTYANSLNLATTTSFTGKVGVSVSDGGFFNPMNGHLSDVRVLPGTALYTTNFVPPITPLQPISGTTLLLNGTSAAIYDASTQNNLETVGDARAVTNITRYGNTSMFFDGSGDYLLAPSSPAFDFPGNFTIEMWINFANVNSTWQAIISRAYDISGGWRLYKNDGNNQLRWYSVSTSVILTTGSTLANNTWSHIAVVRNGGTVTIYIDGVNRGSATNATSHTPGNYALEIGSGVVTSSFPVTGNISDLRITRGVARYTANFTPPAAAHQTR